MKRYVVGTAGLLALLLSFSSPAHAAKYTINWYLGHPNLDYFEEAAANFKKAVEAGSHGEIEVKVITLENDALNGGKSASAPEIAAMVEKGQAQMGHSFTDVMAPLDPRLMAFEAPYLFRGYRHMEGVFEGPVGAD